MPATAIAQSRPVRGPSRPAGLSFSPSRPSIRRWVSSSIRQRYASPSAHAAGQVIEHPHLLSTQVAFTVSGPRRKIDEFAEGLKAEGWATMRSELAVMASPL